VVLSSFGLTSSFGLFPVGIGGGPVVFVVRLISFVFSVVLSSFGLLPIGTGGVSFVFSVVLSSSFGLTSSFGLVPVGIGGGPVVFVVRLISFVFSVV